MKKLVAISIFAFLIAAGTTTWAQNRNNEYLGLPGDNLNLYAVMKLFQESETLEGFERNLNSESNRINNLDLNGDNQVDYITVTDYVDGNVHNIVLRIALAPNESQDVAVFTVQRFSDGSAQIQLIGDEELYGKNYIVEPIYADNNVETSNPGYTGRVVYRTTTVEIAAWPLVRFIYYPEYIAWHSPWYWGCCLSWWNPWRPWYWHAYYGYHRHWYSDYYCHFRLWNHYRYERYNDFYFSHHRMHSPMMGQRIREGNYRHTYSHPESGREGALYARMNSGRNEGFRNNTNIGNRERNSVSSMSRNRNNEGAYSSAGRRSSSTISTGSSVGNRVYSSPSANRNSGFSQRSPENVANKSATRSASVQNGTYSRRSEAYSSNRISSSPTASRNSGISQRSSATMSSRSSGTPSIQRSASSQRSSPSYSTRSSSGSRSTPSLKSTGSSSGRSSSSVRSGGGSRGGRSSGGSMARGNSGGGHSSSGRSGRR
jgi:hypothetical protein